MNILVLILQILLALYNLAGGAYMIANTKIVANPTLFNSLPLAVWHLLGILQILFALGLVLPLIVKSLPKQTVRFSAVGLTIISLLGIFLYSAYSGFPGMLWGLIPALLTAFVAYKA